MELVQNVVQEHFLMELHVYHVQLLQIVKNASSKVLARLLNAQYVPLKLQNPIKTEYVYDRALSIV